MVKYRMYKSSKEAGEETIFDVVSQETLRNLRTGDSVGVGADVNLGIIYYKVVSRAFYEDVDGPYCDVVVEKE